jgi:hypothetical protein
VLGACLAGERQRFDERARCAVEVAEPNWVSPAVGADMPHRLRVVDDPGGFQAVVEPVQRLGKITCRRARESPSRST